MVFLAGLVGIAATIAHSAQSPLIHRRCAFDIGSGETKLSVAEVVFDEHNPAINKLLAKKVSLPFVRTLNDGFIPNWLIEETIVKFKELKSECDGVGAREYFGVATSGFRMARNAHEALARIVQETKIPLSVISGEQEAALAFSAAAAALKSDGKNLVVWDIGGGSLQFSMRTDHSRETRRDYVISSGHQGAELFRMEIAKRLNREAANPMAQSEMIQAIELAKQWSRAVNPKIIERLGRGDMRVVGMGGIHTESLAAQASQQFQPPYDWYTLDAVRSAAQRAVNMSDGDFRKSYPAKRYPESQATNVALVLGYMEALGIKKVLPVEVTVADGLLVDQIYWLQK
jgi:exopolyphosphatase / guanosine-5'-triphosphate,3'-diphosphate pyrophosphatase